MESESAQQLLSAASEALESRGAMRSIRARLLAELFEALEEKPPNSAAPPLEAQLINELICEYLRSRLEGKQSNNKDCRFLHAGLRSFQPPG
ncbi:hypothetical protein Esti_003399 [Eimeria stiedai]